MRDSFRTFDWEKALVEPEVIVAQIRDLIHSLEDNSQAILQAGILSLKSSENEGADIS